MALQFVLVAIIFGGLGLYFGFNALKQKRIMENTPTSKIRSLALGPVEIKGTVTEENAMKSPISNRDCVYYNYKIQEYRSSGKSGRWVTLKSDIKGREFYIKDSTGKVLVDSFGANMEIKHSYDKQTIHMRQVPEHLNSFLESQGLSIKKLWIFKSNYRLIELIIRPKQFLYVFGAAQIKETEGKAKNEDNLIIKYKKGVPFCISEKPELELVKKYKWKSLGFIIGGAILFTVGVFMLIAVLGSMFGGL